MFRNIGPCDWDRGEKNGEHTDQCFKKRSNPETGMLSLSDTDTLCGEKKR